MLIRILGKYYYTQEPIWTISLPCGTDHTGILGNSMKRGSGAVLTSIPLVPYDADVSNGATREAFEEIKAGTPK